MLAIFKREMRSYFTGVIGYVFLVLFLAVGGGVFCYTTMFSMTSEVTGYFTIMLLFSAIILPILTMKSFSEERKAKTEQLLLTAPVSIPSMVVGKFLASYAMFAGALIFNSLYFLIGYECALNSGRLLCTYGSIEHIASSAKLFCTHGIKYSSRVNTRHNGKRDT